MKNIYLAIACVFLVVSGFSQENHDTLKSIRKGKIPHPPAKQEWVDSVFYSLSPEERIAQLFFIRANHGKDYELTDEVTRFIEDYNVGGITFFGGYPTRQAELTNKWQEKAKTPLFISIDGEWGLGMRLDSTISYPYQMTLGAVNDDSLLYEMGKQVAMQMKRMGIHINFAPVADINNNPDNPVINVRSFGESREMVTRKTLAYMRGMQDNGVMATAKHFPGHGDTETDSHHELPVIHHSRKVIDSIDLYPFRRLINEGVELVMTAHLSVPALDSADNAVSSRSEKIIQGVLRKELGFEGLVITDGLEMKGITANTSPDSLEIKILKAGNDILLLPPDLEQALKNIKHAADSGLISNEIINKKCRKILAAKYDAGLWKPQQVDTNNLVEDLNKPGYRLLNRNLYESSTTIIKDEKGLIPLMRLDTLNMASVSIGAEEITPFQNMLANYYHIRQFAIPKDHSPQGRADLMKLLEDHNLVMISIHNTSVWPFKEFGISKQSLDLIEAIAHEKTVILSLAANPYSLAYFSDMPIETIILGYQENDWTHELAAQVIFGGLPAKGILPVSVDSSFLLGRGRLQQKKIRFEFTIPEELGLTGDDLYPIDTIIIKNIDDEAFPGCQVVFAKDGKVFYNRSYGFHTYDKAMPVKHDDIYDLASITKIAASTIAVMQLVQEGRLDIDEPLGAYLPYLKGSEKEHLILRDVLTHQAGLVPWIPFYIETLDSTGQLKPSIYNEEITEEFPVRVAEDLYIHRNYRYTIFDTIKRSPLQNGQGYIYSDLGFYFLYRLVENVTNRPFEEYVNENIYKPLGLSNTSFMPREHFDTLRLVPTEDDRIYRKQVLKGDVHDPGAAMLGGVCGHAGLFANAVDVAVIMQTLLDEGTYADTSIVDKKLIGRFTKSQFPLNDNRRAIGFDKPYYDFESNGPTCKGVSNESYGHSGFTGTYAWADPKNNLVYVFLSNRVHPDAANHKIISANTRTRIHQVVYDALKKSEKNKTKDDNELSPK
ncbi:MAG: serine hydrolase [Bacteroidales bacterium]|nr:serine hydrolase [Bacteroidales bacterium]